MTSDRPESGLYVRNRGRVSGPHSLADLLRMVRRGTLSRAQEVSRDAANWEHASQFAELFGGPIALGDLAVGAAEQYEPEPSGTGSTAPGARMYYRQEDQTFGPMPIALVMSLAEGGQLSLDAIVWEEGAASSRPARSHPMLEGAAWPGDETDADGSTGTGRRLSGQGVAILLMMVLVLAGGVGGGVYWYRHSSSDKSTQDADATPATAPLLPPAPVAKPAVASTALVPGKAAVGSRRVENIVPVSSTVAQASGAPTQQQRAPTLVSSTVKPAAPAAGADRAGVVTTIRDEATLSQTVGFVVVGATISRPGRDPYELPISTGSCFAVSPEGHLITNNHVVEQNPDFRDAVRKGGSAFDPHVWVFFGKSKYLAQVLFASSKNDLAVLKVERRQPFFRLCGAGSAKRDSDVYALGFPGVAREPLSAEEYRRKQDAEGERHPKIEQYFNERDFEFTLTRGVVSRTIPDSDGILWIQHEAVVRHGNSGGPLVTSDGTVVGVNTRLQKNKENDVQTNNSFEIAQFKPTLQRYIPTAVWDEPRDPGK